MMATHGRSVGRPGGDDGGGAAAAEGAARRRRRADASSGTARRPRRRQQAATATCEPGARRPSRRPAWRQAAASATSSRADELAAIFGVDAVTTHASSPDRRTPAPSTVRPEARWSAWVLTTGSGQGDLRRDRPARPVDRRLRASATRQPSSTTRGWSCSRATRCSTIGVTSGQRPEDERQRVRQADRRQGRRPDVTVAGRACPRCASPPRRHS